MTANFVIEGTDALGRARRALAIVGGERSLGALPLDHVGWFERAGDVQHIVEVLQLPAERMRSIVVAEQLGREVWITRLRTSAGRYIEIFSGEGLERPDSAHLAYRAPDADTLQCIAKSFQAKVHGAADGSQLVYLTSSLEIVCRG